MFEMELLKKTVFFFVNAITLTSLTKKDCTWKGGPLPPGALTTFQELQTYLCAEPIVGYPLQNCPYALIVEASLGDDKKSGGLGAILTQINPDGQHLVIAYTSRKLQKHECNYTPFLLEMQAAI
jgi:RNase H-like domain found in reverse transcriptase